MVIPEGEIRFACTKLGASVVLEAAYTRMAGAVGALAAAGLPAVSPLDDADRVGRIALRAMSATECDAVIAELAAQEQPVFAGTTLHGPF
jgi:hypothetical protein